MGQQPNIKLGVEDLPRPTAHPSPPRRWTPRRVGELSTPEDVPWGGAFGTTGPDTGYALKLLASRDIPLAPGDDRHGIEVALAALMAARASHFGRAPVVEDAEVAEILLGLGSVDESVAAARRERVAGIGHSKSKPRALVAAVDEADLFAKPDELRRRATAGARFLST